ncbi:MAG: AEC family transporter [Dehalobacterium sp.]
MTGQIAVVINQIMVFSILMFIGFTAVRSKAISKDGLNTLSTLIIKIILPAMIFGIVAGSGITIKDFLISGRFAAGVLLCYTILFAAGIIMSKLCQLEGKTENIFIALAAFGNMGFMGIPLIQAIFKEPVAQVCISVYTLVDMPILWTLGVYLCSRHLEESNSLSAVKNMINPTTIALFIAFIIMVFQIPVPSVLMSTISGIGDTSKYLTLIYLGGSLAFVSVNKIYKKTSIFILAVSKMLILPVIVYILLGYFLSGIPRTILTLIVGLPSMTTIAMVGKSYGSDDEYATEVIFVTTIFSLVTIPIVSAITSIL